MRLRLPASRRSARCADATSSCAEQHDQHSAALIGPADQTGQSAGGRLVGLLSTWPGALRLVVVAAAVVGLLAGLMWVTPVRINVGPVGISPAGEPR